MTDPSLVDRYRFYLANARGLRPNTVRAYGADVGRFLTWLDGEDDGLMDMHPFLLGRWVAQLTRDGKKRKTIIRHVSSVRSFYWFLTHVVGQFRASPVPSVKNYPMESETHTPRFLGQSESRRLMEAADDATPCGLRDRALLELMYASGVRLAEAHDMDRGDLDRLRGDVRVVGKGNKERQVLYGADADHALHRYLTHGRPALLVDTEQPALWLNRSGGRLSRRGIATVVRCYADRAGLTSGVHPHVLRHSYATAMLEGGADLLIIQDQMGHSSVATTQIYAHVTKLEARKAYLEHHPMARPPQPRLIIRA